MTDVEINALRCYLQKENYESKNITVIGNTLIIDTSGTLEVEGYGFDTRVETYPIIQTPKNPPSNFPFLFILYIAFAIFTPIITYYFIKSRINGSDGYVGIP
ncbi:fungal-specific transcription factor domain-containing protein [Rhizophagus clarus]|nr:fungal-specific transcription factor domain-containing protein [Rhizophagus clarus]